MTGVIIEEGPQNWQILQQENGFAEVWLAGAVNAREPAWLDTFRVVIRIQDERNGTDVVPPAFLRPINGRWHICIKIPAGGLYTISAFGRFGEREICRGDKIYHIGVGDIYVIAGQSNACGTSRDCVDDGADAFVHIFRFNGRWDIAAHPLHDSTDSVVEDYSDVCGLHSPWLSFAKNVSRVAGIPIGLIPAAKSGVPLSVWNRAENGRLFDRMLEMIRLSGGKVKAVLWYQGCNDAADDNETETYLERFKILCDDFRSSLYPDIPILTVQLNKQTFMPNKSNKRWALLREAQRQAAHQINNVFLVPTVDLPVCDTIHNCSYSNLVIAQRLSNMALKYIYDKSVICDFPDIQRAVLIDKNKIRLYFNNVTDALTTDYCHAEALMFQAEDSIGICDASDIEYNGDNTVDLILKRNIAGNAIIGCTKFSDLGIMPYDVLTRLPAIPFCNLSVEIFSEEAV